MGEEQRKDERVAAPELSKGVLHHSKSNQSFKVECIRDVSSNGIGLKVNGSLDQGEKVCLGVMCDKAHLKMYGHVVWCAAAEAKSSCEDEFSSFMMGIRFIHNGVLFES